MVPWEELFSFSWFFWLQVRLVELHCDAALDMDLTVMKDVPQRDVGRLCALWEEATKNCDGHSLDQGETSWQTSMILLEPEVLLPWGTVHEGPGDIVYCNSFELKPADQASAWSVCVVQRRALYLFTYIWQNNTCRLYNTWTRSMISYKNIWERQLARCSKNFWWFQSPFNFTSNIVWFKLSRRTVPEALVMLRMLPQVVLGPATSTRLLQCGRETRCLVGGGIFKWMKPLHFKCSKDQNDPNFV